MRGKKTSSQGGMGACMTLWDRVVRGDDELEGREGSVEGIHVVMRNAIMLDEV